MIVGIIIMKKGAMDVYSVLVADEVVVVGMAVGVVVIIAVA